MDIVPNGRSSFHFLLPKTNNKFNKSLVELLRNGSSVRISIDSERDS